MIVINMVQYWLVSGILMYTNASIITYDCYQYGTVLVSIRNINVY